MARIEARIFAAAAMMNTVSHDPDCCCRELAKGTTSAAVTLGGVEKSRVGCCELRAERVRAGRREETVDLTPGEEHEAAEEDEPHRIAAPEVEQIDADALHAERDKHRVFAADLV